MPRAHVLFDEFGATTTAGLCGCILVTIVAASFELHRSGWCDLLRAWWIDPAVATLSFAWWIDVYAREEPRYNCIPRGGGVLKRATVAYWVAVAFWSYTVLPPNGGVLPDGVPSSLQELGLLCLEVGFGIVMYDALFFMVHWGMHVTSCRAHKKHHAPHNIRASDVLEHSALDGGLQVLVNIAVQRRTIWGVKSRLARAMHNIVVTWMLTESHTAAPTMKFFRRCCAGVQRHRAHHMQSAPYFQQFFGYLDDAKLAVFPVKFKGGTAVEQLANGTDPTR
jgi:hypothetical protein